MWNEKIDKVNETMAFIQEYVVIHLNEEESYMQETVEG
jgi:hemerythrin